MLIAILMSLQACAGFETAVSVGKAAKEVVCTNTTAEWRTEVRGKQSVKTNACQDKVGL